MFSKLITASLIYLLSALPLLAAADNTLEAKAETKVSQLDKPLYSPFIERYVLDEIKQLRIDQAQTKLEFTREIVDREHRAVDRAVSYATDTITYFFNLIAGCSSILVLVGWNSLRELKERVHSNADEQIAQLVSTYETRLSEVEQQLRSKTKAIEDNRDEIEQTQEIQALWLKAQQDQTPASQIKIYDQILALKNADCAALTYKADAVLELGEPQWAINLCHQALDIEPEHSHANFQLACAYSLLGYVDEAIDRLTIAVELNESYRSELASEPAFESIKHLAQFKALLLEADILG